MKREAYSIGIAAFVLSQLLSGLLGGFCRADLHETAPAIADTSTDGETGDSGDKEKKPEKPPKNTVRPRLRS